MRNRIFSRIYNKGVYIDRIDHYLMLRIDNSEIIKMIPESLRDTIVIKEIERSEFCIPTMEYRYNDKWGNYRDN